jgi:NAD-dependent dihydropyrimidine dehydrogenase PreA subunit
MNQAAPEINTAKCTGCGECVEQCPTEAVELLEGKAVIVAPEDCCYCTNCESICPEEAIRCPFEIILAEGKQ